MTTKDFPVFDIDSYVVEPPSLWEKCPGPRVPLAGQAPTLAAGGWYAEAMVAHRSSHPSRAE